MENERQIAHIGLKLKFYEQTVRDIVVNHPEFPDPETVMEVLRKVKLMRTREVLWNAR